MKNVNKILSLASVATMLASITALPVSASQINAYSVSYETLTQAIETTDGNIIPAGSVAVTMSVKKNQGFDSDTITLNMEDGYTVLTDKNGYPVVQKESLLNQALVAASVNENAVCVTVATEKTCTASGKLFTLYAASNGNEEIGFTDVSSVDFSKIKAEDVSGGIQPNSFICDDWLCYYGGDCNNDNRVNSEDASIIMQVTSKLSSPKYLTVATYKYLNYFPSVIIAEQPDANGDGIISNFGTEPDGSDAYTILQYAACAGVGNDYTGFGCETVGQKIRAYKLA